ncbi:molybdenum ABC transporter ModABC, permease protein [Campylobacter subantarcticus LMG 24377]|uniref:Molybdenum transport system permease n=2 Tax=Campylobacter subantarcticus TaxID=497724 RepID=A0A0A8H8F8_9BACT|nr:molybdate ABC transporter permease subunit [Campylobacter subantarcticus]EAJ1261870.1 molybdate ABC transporter permease subunit [Campylobacter lari]AJC90366.1 molybdenum ABC transporter ModABC, permease protein [Campylobacter subantarcticus LMG 24374]AJC92028.1 molybdenum ABC transporter ModABC, permease protein [Campylobacter subantarcticus LMG 24377]EAL3938809.1 molybdate ABC transporter permease subunit [Campylobacter lari]MPB98830.1 molybdate ABC transporter permease subunit [Campyloba
MLQLFQNIDWTPFLVSIKLSIITCVILFCFCVPLAWIFAFKHFRTKKILETIITLPLVLPPSVVGFYLLILFSKYSFLGEFLEKHFDIALAFTFEGLVIASCIYSLPFMFNPLYTSMTLISKNVIEASFSLGKNSLITLFKVVLPHIKLAMLSALVISFAHTMGEFGIVLMIGGSLSGETKVASIAIYESMENLDFATAHIYSLILLIFSFIVLLSVNLLKNK